MWKQVVGSVGAFVLGFLLYWRRLIQQRPRKLEWPTAPTLKSSLFSMLLCIIFKREGKFFSGFTTVPRLEGVLKNAKVESSRYAEYQRICDVSEPKDTALADGSLRVACPVFPEVLVFSIIPQLVTLPEFPLSPMGLIHYKTVVTVFKEIPIGASLDFHMHIDGHRETDRGIEVDIIMEARFNATDEIVWKCVETVLSRNKSRGKKATGPAEKPAEEPEIWKQVTFSVPANMGLKYAKVSGDYNPYHCYPLAAKLFGFKRAIAHGMWSMERCVSELRAAGVCPTQLPLVIESQFKLPVYLPSDVLLSFTTKSDAVATTEFKLTSPDGKLPYVAGKVYMMSQ